MTDKKVRMYLIAETLDDTPCKIVEEFENLSDLNRFVQDVTKFDGNNISYMKIVSGIVLADRQRTIDA